MISKHIISTNTQKILSYLLNNPNKPFYERDIARKSNISFGSANKLLNQLYKDGVLNRKEQGRMFFYSINMSNVYVKELKVLNNLLFLEPLVEKLKPITYKITLFGSWADGTDTEASDIDIFIVAAKSNEVSALINKFSQKSMKKIQAVIKTPEDMLNIDDRDAVFMKKVQEGKILWEKEPDEDNI